MTPSKVNPKTGELSVPSLVKSKRDNSKSIKYPKKHILKLMRYDIAINNRLRYLLKKGVS